MLEGPEGLKAGCLLVVGHVSLLAFQDVCPTLVTLLFVVKMPLHLGQVAAMEEFALQKSCENTRWVE
jgi:hypothetical protein